MYVSCQASSCRLLFKWFYYRHLLTSVWFWLILCVHKPDWSNILSAPSGAIPAICRPDIGMKHRQRSFTATVDGWLIWLKRVANGEYQSRWWFQIFFIFTPTGGKIPNLTIIFFKWVGEKPPPSKWIDQFWKCIPAEVFCSADVRYANHFVPPLGDWGYHTSTESPLALLYNDNSVPGFWKLLVVVGCEGGHPRTKMMGFTGWSFWAWKFWMLSFFLLATT